MDHIKAIYLRLSPEFGEHRFGPYENLEVRIGSDQQNCAICIENFGALPIHAKLLIQGEKDLILVPSERSAEVFLWRKNHAPEQIFGATAVIPGDAFSIIMANGPKFIIEWDELPEEIKEQREKAASRGGVGRNRLSKDSMKGEAKRQVFTQLLVMGPMQLLQRAVIFVKSGAIYQPRNIIAGAVLLSGWILGGSMSCRSSKLKKQTTVVKSELSDCQNNLSFQESLSSNKKITLYDAINGVTKSDQLAQLLKKDTKLRSLVKEKSLALINKDAPEWLVEKTNDPYALKVKRWIAAVRSLDDTEIDSETKNLLIWNISEKGKSNRSFTLVDNPMGEYQCGRGIMELSFRQSIHLGLETQVDAPYKGNATNLSKEAKISQLRTTITKALGSAEEFAESQALVEALENQEMETEQLYNRSLQSCIYASGEDEREENIAMLRQLKKMIGPGIKGLPKEDNFLSPGARLAKLYVADIDGMDFRERQDQFKFSGTLSAAMDDLNQEGKWVLEKTAKTIARSIVLPCKVVLEGSEEAKILIGGDEQTFLPDPISCLIFDWKVRNSE